MKHPLYLIILLAIVGMTTQTARSQATWTQVAAFGAGSITEARAFSIGSKGYIGAATPDLWEYDPATNAWTQKAAFSGPTRMSAVGFSIGTKGYFGTGDSYNDFYAYDAVANTWTQKAPFGGSGREGAVGCAVNGKGYLGLGGNYLNDWWEYDPVADAWTQKANIGGPGRYHAGAFAIGAKAYVSCGFNGNFLSDLWEFDPAANTWTAKAPYPGTALDRPVGLSSGNKGYIITGWTGGMALDDAWEWDPASNTWTALPDFGGAPRYNACGFVIGTKLYVGTGYASGTVDDVWEFGNSCNVQTSSIPTSCAGNCDGTATIDFPDPAAATGYLWSTGDTTQSVSNLCAGAYTVAVTDTSGCSTTVTIVVGDPPPVTASFTATIPTCHGGTDGMICAVPSGGQPPYSTYSWSTGDTTACVSGVMAGAYTITITDSAGCSGSTVYSLVDPPAINISFLVTNASCPTCSDGSASANVSGGVFPYSYSWSNGGTLVFIAGLKPGTYTCCVTDSNGCVQCDSVVVAYTVGMPEADAGEISIEPNPFHDRFYMLLPGPKPMPPSRISVTLWDATGRRAAAEFHVDGDRLIVILPHAVPGIYVGEVHTDAAVYRFRVAGY